MGICQHFLQTLRSSINNNKSQQLYIQALEQTNPNQYEPFSRKQNMITEQYKDTVFFSNLFARHYPLEYKQIKQILQQNHVRSGLLYNTADYWCRDYMPVQRYYNDFVQFKYFPDYLQGKEPYRTDSTPVIQSLKLNFHYNQSPLNIDGGNIVSCEQKQQETSHVPKLKSDIIMTEKIFKENPSFTRQQVMEELCKTFPDDDIILIPWDKEDICGHTDGIVHNIGDGKILANLNLYPQAIAKEMRKRFEARFDVVDLEISKYHENSWAYINMLQTRDIIIVPGLGLPQDKEALEQIRKLHPSYEDRIYQVNIATIIKEWGGGINCMTWTVSNEMSKLHHTNELDKRFKVIVNHPNIHALSWEDISFAGNYQPTLLPYELDKLYFGF